MNDLPNQKNQDHPEDEPTNNAESQVTLRCNRCGKPITPATAVLTPTGYRCKDCLRSQQKAFDTTSGFDVPLGFIISFLIAFAGSWLVPRTGFLTILIAPGLGLLIYNAVRTVLKRRRSSALNKALLLGAVIGCLPALFLQVYPLFFIRGGVIPSLYGLLPAIWHVVYLVLVASTAYAQSTGIRLN